MLSLPVRKGQWKSREFSRILATTIVRSFCAYASVISGEDSRQKAECVRSCQLCAHTIRHACSCSYVFAYGMPSESQISFNFHFPADLSREMTEPL